VELFGNLFVREVLVLVKVLKSDNDIYQCVSVKKCDHGLSHMPGIISFNPLHTKNNLSPIFMQTAWIGMRERVNRRLIHTA